MIYFVTLEKIVLENQVMYYLINFFSEHLQNHSRLTNKMADDLIGQAFTDEFSEFPQQVSI